MIVSNVIHRQQLINNSLATNYEYAAKVASISDLYFKNIFNDLSLSANIIKNGFHNEQLLKTELNRLIQQSNSFSSVLISDADGHVIEYAPETLKLDKVAIIRSLGFSKSLESKKGEFKHEVRQFQKPYDNQQAEQTSNGVSQSNAFLGRVFSDMAT